MEHNTLQIKQWRMPGRTLLLTFNIQLHYITQTAGARSQKHISKNFIKQKIGFSQIHGRILIQLNMAQSPAMHYLKGITLCLVTLHSLHYCGSHSKLQLVKHEFLMKLTKNPDQFCISEGNHQFSAVKTKP